MRFSRISAAITTAATLTVLGGLATPANAFLLTNTSASWDNARLLDGKVVGKSATNADFDNYEQAAFADSNDNYVDFIEENGVSQVRWGDPYYNHYTHADAVEGGYNGVWDYGTYTNKYGYQYTDWHIDWTGNKSGLGFAGVNDKNLGIGQVFNLGALKHYNNTIWSNNRIANKVDFSLNLDFADAAIGSQTFDFSLNVDETANNASSHTGGVCPYQTDAGKGCSDKITWDFAVDAENKFTYNNEEYTLELVGFSENALSSNIVNQFISQESGTSEANLWARLVKVEAQTEDVPEPTALLGLSALGLYLVKSRRDKAAVETA
ncbi:MAG: choice-of-anchor K domain-containing protein [Cyanobacteria bacterium J06635_1]